MRSNDLRSMSMNELWTLHEEVVAKLPKKIAAEKERLEERRRKIEVADKVTRLDPRAGRFQEVGRARRCP
jgi:DNA-binding protein H-NS